MVRVLAAAACVTTTALSTAVLPAFPQSVPRFPTFEISVTTETFHPAAVRLKPSSAAQADQSDAKGELLELSYSAPDLIDQLVSFSSIGNGTLPVVCGTAPPDAAASRFAACSAFVASSLGDWAFSFQSKAWNGAVDSDGWRLNALLHDVTVAAASDLSTPLDPFMGAATSGVSRQVTSDLGISTTSIWGRSISGTETSETPTWGISVRTPSGLEMIGTSAGVQAYQHVTIASADLFTGITPLGPLVGAEATFGALSISAAALDFDGQFQGAATISLQMGDLRLSYVTGPAGSGIVGLFNAEPFNIGFSVDSSDFGFTLAYALGDGQTLQASGSGLNGFQVAFVASIGPGSPVTVPLGAGSLSLTPPQPGSGAPAFRLQWPLPAATPTSRPPLPATTPPSPGAEKEGTPRATDDDQTP